MVRLAPRRFGRLSIAAYLGLGIGGLMFLAVGSTLAVTLYATWRNTTELFEDKSRLLLGALVEHIERYMEPAVFQADYVAGLIERGEIDEQDRDQLLDTLRSVLAAAPQVHALAFLDAQGWQAYVARHGDRLEPVVQRWDDDRQIVDLMRRAEERASGAAYWGPPVYAGRAGTVLNLRRPVLRDGEFLGIVAAVVRVADLSAFVAALESELGQNAFVLYDRDYVLAHLALESNFPGLSDQHPLPRVTEIGDPVLFEIWSAGWQDRRLVAGSGHQGRVGGKDYVYLYTPLTAYGGASWLVGSYFVEDAVAQQYRRLMQAAAIGLFGLLLAIVSGFLFGLVLRGPIDQLGAAASAVRTLDLEKVPTLSRSWFRELDDAARAFNGMVAALRAFALYVPRTLVTTLIARGDVAALPSEVRDVTVLFTDIVGFTARAETMGAAAAARFLNDHFALVTACIEREDGIVDKYIGDAVMAVWGPIEAQADHSVRAVRAARAIAEAVRADNAEREPPVRMRIGIHSGPAIVGNVGTPTRMNYTVVGDTVNTAQRLENLGSDLLPDAEIAILLSESTASALPCTFALVSLGAHQLRGRGGPTEVFTLAD